jgi:hypothetical protein
MSHYALYTLDWCILYGRNVSHGVKERDCISFYKRLSVQIKESQKSMELNPFHLQTVKQLSPLRSNAAKRHRQSQEPATK